MSTNFVVKFKLQQSSNLYDELYYKNIELSITIIWMKILQLELEEHIFVGIHNFIFPYLTTKTYMLAIYKISVITCA